MDGLAQFLRFISIKFTDDHPCLGQYWRIPSSSCTTDAVILYPLQTVANDNVESLFLGLDGNILIHTDDLSILAAMDASMASLPGWCSSASSFQTFLRRFHHLSMARSATYSLVNGPSMHTMSRWFSMLVLSVALQLFSHENPLSQVALVTGNVVTRVCIWKAFVKQSVFSWRP